MTSEKPAASENTIIGLEIHAYLDTKSKLFCSCPTSAFSIPWVKDYLEEKDVKFEFVEHEAVTRPVDSARVRGVKIEQIAKALVYMIDDAPALLLLSGNRKASEEKALAALSAKKIKMATPAEVKAYTKCVVGLVPPTIDGIRKIIDGRLVDEDLWSFNAGMSTAGIKIKRDELLKILDNYVVANISEDNVIEEKPESSKHFVHTIEAEPNTLCCPICLGHPGSKPVLNERAVDLGTKIGLAMNCEINKEFFFSRKTYFYPDMSYNYQITQYEIPLAQNGYVTLPGGKKIGIRRAHLEWDPAALVHPNGMGKSEYVLIDYNRSGLPLVEIVTKPDIESPREAREFMNILENILNYLRVLKPDTTLKVDCNISINGGNRVEIKNVSGFAAVEKALNFELVRQKQEVRLGRTILQHTRAFDADTGMTKELRKKETEEDYGYIFDPDLVMVTLDDKFISGIKKTMPELPELKAKRYVQQFGLVEFDANVLCGDFALTKLFEEMVGQKAEPTISARLLTREVLSVLNYDSLSFSDIVVKSSDLTELVKLIVAGKASDKNIKLAIINYISGDSAPPAEYLSKNNLLVTEQIDINSIIDKVIAANKKAVDDYKAGNEKSFNFLAGQIMRETKGTVLPQKVQEILKQRLA